MKDKTRDPFQLFLLSLDLKKMLTETSLIIWK